VPDGGSLKKFSSNLQQILDNKIELYNKTVVVDYHIPHLYFRTGLIKRTQPRDNIQHSYFTLIFIFYLFIYLFIIHLLNYNVSISH
jgi:hypothetical protein